MREAGTGSVVARLSLRAVVIAVGGLQVMYVGEHLLQFVYWLGSPAEPPWVAPWTRAVASAAARLHTPYSMSLGIELIPLIFVAVVLFGLAALVILISATASESHAAQEDTERAKETVRVLLWVETLLFAEHAALVLTFLRSEHSIGVSTLFGLVSPGPVLWTYHIWWYFLTSAAATVLFVRAVRQYLRASGAYARTASGVPRRG